MPETYTIQRIIADEALLRLEAAKILDLPPSVCRDLPIEVIAERLVKNVLKIPDGYTRLWKTRTIVLLDWLRMSPAEQSACAIAAIRGGEG